MSTYPTGFFKSMAIDKIFTGVHYVFSLWYLELDNLLENEEILENALFGAHCAV